MSLISPYYDQANIEAGVQSGDHRAIVGGLWDEIGQLQFDFLLSNGLQPTHKLLDIGCGSLRAGVKFVRYLDSGNYYGTDINQSLLAAGYDIELAREGLTHKVPRANLVQSGDFEFRWREIMFDFVLAQSLFTHLPLNFLRVCLEQLHGIVAPGAPFFATFFEIADEHPSSQPYSHPSGVITHGAKDPYHYRFSDIEYCCRNLPWTAIKLGSWNHPRSQHMIKFVRL